MIGIANIIPGLSGSTMAIVLGVYEKIIDILTKIDYKMITNIRRFNFQNIKERISLNFLTSILIGIIISFVTLAHLLNYLFTNFETYTWAYFFGIIMGSTVYIAQSIKVWEKKEIFFCIIGFITSLSILFIEPSVENDNLLFVFICGIIGVVGMLIPGLSGSYLLILLGNYKLLISTTIYYITKASLIQYENYMYLKIFISFLFGQIVGILIFSRLIKFLLNNYKSITFATLTGFVGGSLIYIWPWKQEILNQKMIYSLSYPIFQDTNDMFAIALIFIGISTVILIDHIAKQQNV